MASFLTEHYRTAEEKIIRSLTASDLRHRYVHQLIKVSFLFLLYPLLLIFASSLVRVLSNVLYICTYVLLDDVT